MRHLCAAAALTTPEAGIPRLRAWSASARARELQALNKCCATLARWLDQSATYFL